MPVQRPTTPSPDPERPPLDDIIGVMARQCTARSPRGAVAAAAPTAALAGARALAAGGNAYDAVVTAALCETVLLPPKCGLAGDLVAMVWPAGERPAALLAVGGAASGLADAATRGALLETGPNSVGVPGAPGGYLALAERAVLELDELARPAIEAARDGFCWSEICATLGQESIEVVSANTPDGSRYFPGGAPLAAGAVVALPGLAAALEHLVADRWEFLRGSVGQAIVRRVVAAGGVLGQDDLARQQPEWVDPVSIGIGDRIVYATPAPTHGPSLLHALEAGDELGPPELYRSVMAAIARRRDVLTDPSGTSMVSAVDGDGTLAVVVHSNSFPRFGSGLIVDEFDLVLSNRAGRGFSSEVSHPNFGVSGRRPATTLHAWGLAHRDGRRLLGATPGGANQMPWNAQSLVRLLGGDEVSRAVVAPRWEWRPVDDCVRFEIGLEAAIEDELARSAPSVEAVGLWGLRSAMQIVTSHDGVGTAVVDPRTQGGVIPL